MLVQNERSGEAHVPQAVVSELNSLRARYHQLQYDVESLRSSNDKL